MRPIGEINDWLASKRSDRDAPPWTVRQEAPKLAASRPRSWLDRMLHRREPSTYQRCLAVHIHFSSPRGGLS